jgi:hypothetical protein
MPVPLGPLRSEDGAAATTPPAASDRPAAVDNAAQAALAQMLQQFPDSDLGKAAREVLTGDAFAERLSALSWSKTATDPKALAVAVAKPQIETAYRATQPQSESQPSTRRRRFRRRRDKSPQPAQQAGIKSEEWQVLFPTDFKWTRLANKALKAYAERYPADPGTSGAASPAEVASLRQVVADLAASGGPETLSLASAVFRQVEQREAAGVAAEPLRASAAAGVDDLMEDLGGIDSPRAAIPTDADALRELEELIKSLTPRAGAGGGVGGGVSSASSSSSSSSASSSSPSSTSPMWRIGAVAGVALLALAITFRQPLGQWLAKVRQVTIGR